MISEGSMIKRLLNTKVGAGMTEAIIALAVILLVSMGGITVISSGTIANDKTAEYQYMRLAISNSLEVYKFSALKTDAQLRSVKNKMDTIYQLSPPTGEVEYKCEYSTDNGGNIKITFNGKNYNLYVHMYVQGDKYQNEDVEFYAELKDKDDAKTLMTYGYNKYTGYTV